MIIIVIIASILPNLLEKLERNDVHGVLLAPFPHPRKGALSDEIVSIIVTDLYSDQEMSQINITIRMRKGIQQREGWEWEEEWDVIIQVRLHGGSWWWWWRRRWWWWWWWRRPKQNGWTYSNEYQMGIEVSWQYSHYHYVSSAPHTCPMTSSTWYASSPIAAIAHNKIVNWNFAADAPKTLRAPLHFSPHDTQIQHRGIL